MKSKTLLIAAATLAAGVMAASAAVYSQNIVGYVNVVIKGNGSYNLLANPLDDGNGNYLTNLLSTNVLQLPKNSQALFWNPAGGYFTANYGGNPPNWAAGTSFQCPPGVGFFIKNGKTGNGDPDVTNTFVGTVIIPSGGSGTNQVAAGISMYGSLIPYAGNIANLGSTGGDANMDYGDAMTVKKSYILTYDPTLNAGAGGFTTANFGGSLPYTWGSTVTIQPGQGFFMNNLGVATNVIQNASY